MNRVRVASGPALPGDVLQGLALRPPDARWDGRRYHGSALAQARLADAQAIAGVVAVVQHTHFLGVVAVSAVCAQQGAAALSPAWRAVEDAGLHAPAASATALSATRYVWQLRGEASDAAGQVVVWCADGHASVWLPACAPELQQMLRRELAGLLQLPDSRLDLITSPGRVDDDTSRWHPLELIDAAADAALLSRAVGRPVGVGCRADRPTAGRGGELVLQLPALALSDAAAPQPLTLLSHTPWAMRPSLARLLSQPELALAAAGPSVQGAGVVQASTGTGALLHAAVHELHAAQVFAQESLWHERALAQGLEPLSWRVQQMPEGRGKDLAQQVLAHALSAPSQGPAPEGRLLGRGLATAQVQIPGEAGADLQMWSTWVAEVAVDPQTGRIEVTRVVAGHDSQSLVAAQTAPVRLESLQESGRLQAGVRQLLGGPAAFDDWNPAQTAPAPPAGALALRGGSADVAAHKPQAGLLRQHGSLDVQGVATLPAAAAIANAIAQATGVRLREVPFQPEQLRRALAGASAAPARGLPLRAWGWLAAGAAAVAGLAAMAWPLKPAMPLTAGPDVSLYSPQALERGRRVAAAGDCVVCHTAPGGAANAGGLGLDTPFGTIYSTNITPDHATGIGRWSYGAFERAMRQGIHQDGRQLYPAFPYTAFAKLSDGDLQALYGYLMAQPPVASRVPETRLAFPYNLRPAMAGWNLLFHDATPFQPDPAKSAEWNRGAYLVEGAGHCAACHSPRNALGAEKAGIDYLGGGQAEGWSAPALNRLADGKLAWTGDELYRYLRTGYSARHGVAAGPMAPVIHGLAELPDSDLRSMASYLMALPGRSAKASPAAPDPVPAPAPVTVAAAQPLPVTTTAAVPAYSTHVSGERLYQNACAVCHEAGSGPTLFGVKPLLGRNTNLHAASPDNLIQVVLDGIQTPASDALGYMPGFRNSLDDRQIADLLGYLRERFAPQEAAWPDDTAAIARLRSQGSAHRP